MYRVIIAEDEMFVRLGLKNLIPWGKYNMEVTADFPNGEQALDYYLKEMPDLVITDIKMPVMDGMELVKRIRQVSEETQIILLTCVEEFEAVQEAVHLGVLGYISKLSMKEDDMEKVVEKAMHVLDRQNQAAGTCFREADQKIIRQNLLKQIVFSNLYSRDDIRAIFRENSVNLTENGLTLCLLDVGQIEGMQKSFGDDKDYLIQFSLMNVIEETVSASCRGEMVPLSDERYLLFLSFEEAEGECVREKVLVTLSNLRNALKRYFNLTLFVAVSSPSDSYERMFCQYKEALAALKDRFLLSPQCAYAWFEERKGTQDLEARLYGLIGGECQQKFLPPEAGKELCGKVHSMVMNSERWQEDTAKILYELCGLMIEGSIMKEEKKQKAAHTWYLKLHECRYLEEMELCCRNLEEFLLANSSYGKCSREISQALAYLEQSYGQEIRLADVAARVGLSPAYFSTLFKKEMKTNFVEYLYGLRIGKAQNLLLTTDLNINEISEKVGIADSAYFCRIFKKKTGFTASSWRKYGQRGERP